MGVDLKQFELDRIVNMLKAFGWRVVSTSTAGAMVTATFEKEVKPVV